MKKALFVLMCIALVCTLMPIMAMADTFGDYTEEAFAALDVTTVIRDENSTTGYYVTFRYKDAEATRVHIFGEWAFTDPHYAGLGESMSVGPEEWQNGYVTWGTWPTNEMVKNEATGIWSYTIPLPSGSWNYRFYVGGDEGTAVNDYTGAVRTWDPNNVPNIYDPTATDLTNDESSSSIFVPYDPEKQSESLDFSVETPRDGENGTILYDAVTVSDGSSASFGIYLPYGFNAERKEPYPVLVLTHGGGGTESSWIVQGQIGNILDNLIAEGKVEPFVLVTPNLTDYPSPRHVFDRPMIMSNILDYILPYMVENYNVSANPDQRAIGGMSMGGATTYYALFNHTEEFRYYLPMSGFISREYEPDYTMEALKTRVISIGAGWFDFCLADVAEDFMAQAMNLTAMNNFAANGIPYSADLVASGHAWVTWRHNIAWMLENVLWK